MLKKSLFLSCTIAITALLLPGKVTAHCEIPCGIYDDSLRFDMLSEHVTTMEKSMLRITDLSSADVLNHNQIVRWVSNKESHADKFQEIVSQYFMTQRLKPTDSSRTDFARYNALLTYFHEMLVAAMKCKQTTNQTHIDKLRALIESAHEVYFGPDKQ